MPDRHRGSDRYDPHPYDQAESLQRFIDMTGPEWTGYGRDGDYEPRRAERNRDRSRGVRRHYGDLRGRGQALLSPREVTPGALRDRYDIPAVTFARKEARGLFLTGIVVAAWIS